MNIIDKFFSSKVVIIAGAAGFIGSHLTERLLQAGAQVIGVDNFVTGNQENLAAVHEHPHLKFRPLDLNNQQDLVKMLVDAKDKFGRIDVILHFASPASPPLYQKYPTETYLVNTIATHNILSWLKTEQPQARFLFASTSEVYGDPQVHPQVESYWGNVNPNGVRSCYDEAKRLAETICGVFHRDYELDTRLVRIFNTYGPRMDLRDGRILPQFIQQIKNNQDLTVYGEGAQTRSYCYVTDLVEGILRLAASENGNGETVNLGNPGEFTVLETAQLVNEITGRLPDQIEFLPLPQDDPLRRRPDITKAQSLLDWEPQISFRDGLRLMLDSYGLEVKV